jgi:hypothetical protein
MTLFLATSAYLSSCIVNDVVYLYSRKVHVMPLQSRKSLRMKLRRRRKYILTGSVLFPGSADFNLRLHATSRLDRFSELH